MRIGLSGSAEECCIWIKNAARNMKFIVCTPMLMPIKALLVEKTSLVPTWWWQLEPCIWVTNILFWLLCSIHCSQSLFWPQVMFYLVTGFCCYVLSWKWLWRPRSLRLVLLLWWWNWWRCQSLLKQVTISCNSVSWSARLDPVELKFWKGVGFSGKKFVDLRILKWIWQIGLFNRYTFKLTVLTAKQFGCDW